MVWAAVACRESWGQENEDAGFGVCNNHNRLLRDDDRIRLFLRTDQVREMHMETVVMLAVTALMLVYLIYALLRPEKF